MKLVKLNESTHTLDISRIANMFDLTHPVGFWSAVSKITATLKISREEAEKLLNDLK